MKLALVFRGETCHYTTGHCFARALDYLKVPYVHIDNNQLWANPDIANQFDSAIIVDDGMALSPRPLPLPENSAYYLIDAHVNLEANYLPYLHPFRIIFCAQDTYGAKLLENYGFQNVEWLPLAWDNLDIPYFDYDYVEPQFWRDIPVSFVCSRTTERRWYLAELVTHKYGGYADTAFHVELGNILSRSRIGINDFGGVGNFINERDINLRAFETAGCGALLMQKEFPFDDAERLGLKAAQGWFRNADVNHHFWDRKPLGGDENYVSWSSASQLFETIRYYLDPANKQERVEIAERGRQWAQSHTFVARAKVILERLGIPC